MDHKASSTPPSLSHRPACGAMASCPPQRWQTMLLPMLCVLLLMLVPAGWASSGRGELELNLDNATAALCELEACFSRLSFCWFEQKCVCDRNDALCVAKCAICMDAAWFGCCPCTGLCSVDKLPEQHKVRSKHGFKQGHYSRTGRRNERGLLEKLAAAVEVRSGVKSPYESIGDISLWQFNVSIRNNRPVPRQETTTAAADSTTPVPSSPATESSTTAVSEQHDAGQNGTGTNATAVDTVDIALRKAMKKYRSACSKNQCVTIFATTTLTRRACWQACDRLGAKKWYFWDLTASCECRSECCYRPKGHRKPLHSPLSPLQDVPWLDELS